MAFLVVFGIGCLIVGEAGVMVLQFPSPGQGGMGLMLLSLSSILNVVNDQYWLLYRAVLLRHTSH